MSGLVIAWRRPWKGAAIYFWGRETREMRRRSHRSFETGARRWAILGYRCFVRNGEPIFGRQCRRRVILLLGTEPLGSVTAARRLVRAGRCVRSARKTSHCKREGFAPTLRSYGLSLWPGQQRECLRLALWRCVAGLNRIEPHPARLVLPRGLRRRQSAGSNVSFL